MTLTKKVLVDQRQIVFYSEKYAVRSKAKREAAILKAQKIIDNPSAYSKATSYGALKYIKNVEIDKETGEITATTKGTLSLTLMYLRRKQNMMVIMPL